MTDKIEYLSKPHINEHGNLVIPHDSDPKYHHWKGGQTVVKTLTEIGTPEALMDQYIPREDLLAKQEWRNRVKY